MSACSTNRSPDSLYLEAILQSLAIAPAQVQSRPKFQHDLVLAITLTLEAADPLEVHDHGAARGEELVAADIMLELGEGAAATSRKQARIYSLNKRSTLAGARHFLERAPCCLRIRHRLNLH